MEKAADERTGEVAVTDAATLSALLGGEPSAAARGKDRDRLHDLDRAWLAASPFCVIATADADGRGDASPKGDPAGRLVHVLDDRTLAIAERPGNRRADGYRNVLVNPGIGLLFLIPGRPDTLRVNGRARLVADAPWFDDMVVRGHRPVVAMVMHVEQVFHHCGKAFLRSGLWRHEEWDPEALVPRRAVVARTLERPDDDLDRLDAYYGPSYEEGLYRS
ncbi:MSMEG_1061 family FMN-dependent PPOX-type flavoprotein [Nocardioides sp. CFH 31398]|uniref:MSMEG_1061 family FMN-dependent PPOX-type flavoprotein n=1 Tax=Nocardioides sp. CFH 31398 TaxID=2919579 RepID=UPI001F055F17|nr:MSMEG_1061 family FMN-dependent PPOX-type flavoprotein [Nocardioides sp. CFH 31398]MCH1867573.1 pyridoxamine 5'-phosphate oxidase family protein [Nocardioides sp. CFH 31398]